MIIPPYLKNGDIIALTATARSIAIEQIQAAVDCMQEKGLQVLIDPNIFKVHHQFGGSDQERADFFNAMLERKDVKALWNVRGGYGTGRMVDGINFDLLKQHPKWLIGFSDYTVIHCHVQSNLNMATLHATMPIFMWEKQGGDLELVNEAIQSLYNALTGIELNYIQKGPFKNNRDFEGEVIGGNLSVLMSIMGTKSEPDLKDKILFLEDLDEYYYHIDRMMQTLKRSGKLQHLKALLVGSFIQMHDHTIPFGMTVEESILDYCKTYDFPIIFNVNSGHHLQNMAIPFGVPAKFQNGFLTFAHS